VARLVHLDHLVAMVLMDFRVPTVNQVSLATPHPRSPSIRPHTILRSVRAKPIQDPKAQADPRAHLELRVRTVNPVLMASQETRAKVDPQDPQDKLARLVLKVPLAQLATLRRKPGPPVRKVLLDQLVPKVPQAMLEAQERTDNPERPDLQVTPDPRVPLETTVKVANQVIPETRERPVPALNVLQLVSPLAINTRKWAAVIIIMMKL